MRGKKVFDVSLAAVLVLPRVKVILGTGTPCAGKGSLIPCKAGLSVVTGFVT